MSGISRREFFIGLGSFGLGIVKNSAQKKVDDLFTTEPDFKFNPKKIKIPELIFGDYTCSAIVPGNTNKLLVARTGKAQMSPYVRDANNTARALLKDLNPKSEVKVIDYQNENAEVRKYKNLLVLGGPIASGLTKSLCGYEDRPILLPQGPNKPTEIPIFTNDLSYPAYFNVGTQQSGYNAISVNRPDPMGISESASTYMINYKGSDLVPIIENGNLRSDMLMVIRIPNPWHLLDGYIMIIGGLHGYSLREFFDLDKIDSNLHKLSKISTNKACFQMLIPAEIDDNGRANLLWENEKYGWGEWRLHFDELDSTKFNKIPDDLI